MLRIVERLPGELLEKGTVPSVLLPDFSTPRNGDCGAPPKPLRLQCNLEDGKHVLKVT